MSPELEVGFPKNSNCECCGHKMSETTPALKLSDVNVKDKWYRLNCYELAEGVDPTKIHGYDKLKKRKDEVAKRAAEVEGAISVAEMEGVEEKVETDNELPPTEDQIKKARNEILNVSRHDQADKEKAAASVESDWDVYSEYVVKHIHRIPREGVEALAEILLIDKNVVEACAGKAPL
nr:hypothetical protein [Tanacetum cinerariifolium]